MALKPMLNHTSRFAIFFSSFWYIIHYVHNVFAINTPKYRNSNCLCSLLHVTLQCVKRRVQYAKCNCAFELFKMHCATIIKKGSFFIYLNYFFYIFFCAKKHNRNFIKNFTWWLRKYTGFEPGSSHYIALHLSPTLQELILILLQ